MDAEREIARLRERERQLIEVTSMLSASCDLSSLLARIVTNLRSVTTSDAGSLYIRENADTLRFAVAQNDSRDIPFSSFTMPISPKNLAGYVALSGKPFRFDDVYRIDEKLPFQFNADFDRRFGYRAKSMLVVPMKNRNDKVVGVIQLINKKRDAAARIVDEASADAVVLPFSDEDENFLDILSAQAAIAVERAALYEGIERLLRGVVESSAAAIESRDKTTAGHSQRLAAYLVIMAKRMDRATTGPWRNVHFSNDEIRTMFYAAMLHDIGKIGVRENVLVKANKLTDDRLESVRLRIELEKRTHPERAAEMDEAWAFLKEINIPGFLDDAKHEKLLRIAALSIANGQGDRPLLDEYELVNLGVRKGNLTDQERAEIESHVRHSAEILQKIPWTDDLKRVPEIAGSHHEKINGKGYPNGLAGDGIPFEGRMLAVIDVFEALTAVDRPYKRAMPIPKALEILKQEAAAGSLQQDLVDFFIEARVYEALTDEERRNFTLTADEILARE